MLPSTMFRNLKTCRLQNFLIVSMINLPVLLVNNSSLLVKSFAVIKFLFTWFHCFLMEYLTIFVVINDPPIYLFFKQNFAVKKVIEPVI